ncbi:Hypothetical predicted protein [Pelobates cultripes]|uniref:Uncharacterized protein n=1 Tax=Pelobates cultripes TaxID=61616 RepID=A0AAD1RF01_PELCU|nr:Hypothetical predicted protein [Pelobates cultripes]
MCLSSWRFTLIWLKEHCGTYTTNVTKPEEKKASTDKKDIPAAVVEQKKTLPEKKLVSEPKKAAAVVEQKKALPEKKLVSEPKKRLLNDLIHLLR